MAGGGGGCTKTASHRWLPQNWKLELHNTFPPMPAHQMQSMSSSILRNAKKGASGSTRGEQHPCYKTHLAFTKCHFRFPVNFGTECQTHAQNHMRCLQRFDDWQPEKQFSTQSILQKFQIFEESAKVRHPLPELKEKGSCFDLRFK